MGQQQGTEEKVCGTRNNSKHDKMAPKAFQPHKYYKSVLCFPAIMLIWVTKVFMYNPSYFINNHVFFKMYIFVHL